MEISASAPRAEDGLDAEAGSFSHWYQPGFVPISTDNCGQVLFVDLRPGPWHGCVSEWDHEEGFLTVPSWRSVAAMLADIADALETGEPVLTDSTDRLQAQGFNRDDRAWPQVVNTGELEWVGQHE